MNDELFRVDCARCAALCCVALAFDKSSQFAFNKPAGVPCANLTCDARCSVYDNLSDLGFSGCIKYDCLGAGQRVSQELFADRSWQDDPALLGPMMDAFFALRKAHELLMLLAEAEKLPLAERHRVELSEMRHRLHPDVGWTTQSLLAFMDRTSVQEVHEFLAGLKEYVAVDA